MATVLATSCQSCSRQHATLPRHDDGSGQRVVSAMKIKQSCRPGLLGLDVIYAGMRPAQSARATPSFSISANSHFSTWVNSYGIKAATQREWNDGLAPVDRLAASLERFAR